MLKLRNGTEEMVIRGGTIFAVEKRKRDVAVYGVSRPQIDETFRFATTYNSKRLLSNYGKKKKELNEKHDISKERHM